MKVSVIFMVTGLLLQCKAEVFIASMQAAQN